MRFRGIYAPLATPFDHLGNIYWSKFDYNISQLLRTRLSGFLVADRWGEAPLLSSGEKIRLWKRACGQVGGKARVIATVSGCGVSQARDLVAAAAAAGCSAAVLEAPDLAALAPGVRCTETFHRSVADSSDLPLLLGIRFLGRTGATPEQMASLATHPTVVGAVVVGHAEEAMAEASRLCGRGFSIVTSDLPTMATGLAGGASAAAPAIASIVPFHVLSIEEAVRTRDHAAAADLTRRALDLDRLLRSHGVPAFKDALDRRSFYGGLARLPLLRAAAETREAVSRSLYELAS